MDKTQLWNKTRTLLEMIKFSHTIFAFPFALMGVVLASLANGQAPGFGQVFWICIAMVGARTAAMGLNRLIDAKIDAGNPRTAERHIPAGDVSVFEALLFILFALVIFFFAAWMLNPLCFKLAPVAVFFLFFMLTASALLTLPTLFSGSAWLRLPSARGLLYAATLPGRLSHWHSLFCSGLPGSISFMLFRITIMMFSMTCIPSRHVSGWTNRSPWSESFTG